MGKEYDNCTESESGMTKELTHKELIKKQAIEDADKIRPILEKDPDWPLVSGAQKTINFEDSNRERRALTRLTKKAANLLFPEFKSLACYGSGTSRYWVHVNIVTPEKVDFQKERGITERVEEMLLSTGLLYSSYFTDYGPVNEYAPCLSIEVNDISWGHY